MSETVAQAGPSRASAAGPARSDQAYARVVPSLTRDEATDRASLLAVHSYDIDLDLTGAADGTEFGSTVRIRFTCRQPGAETFVELKDGTPDEVTLNGAA